MTAQTNKVDVDKSEALVRPIEFLTENGFSIFRSWEVDGVSPPVDGTFPFLVRNEGDPLRKVVVTIKAEVIAEIGQRCRGRINISSSFWISCAERHLATYLWEQDDYPEDNNLSVDQLDPEEIISALRWRT